MATQLIRPARTVVGSIILPGDKSISHRYAMLAGLAKGVSRLSNFSTGADPHSSLSCMAALGANIEQKGTHLEIGGTGGHLHAPSDALECGNSGSTMRMLTGLIASHPHTFTLTGDPSLTLRPMQRVRDPLTRMGARITLTDGHAPIRIVGGPLQAIDFEIPVASAQVKTAILFAGLQAQGTTSLSESIRTRDHSEHALRAFGATLNRTETGKPEISRLSIPGGQTLQAIDVTVPGDLSSAAFFLCATLLFPDANLILDSVGMNPTRSALLDLVAALGAKIRVLNLEEHHGELVGTLQVTGGLPPRSSGQTKISGALTAQLIDELPVLAAIAPYTRDGLSIRDAKELRVKESDRLDLIVRNLQAMGASVVEHEDGVDIPGGQTLHGARIDSGTDHRIAMAFSIAALRATSESEIHGAEAAAISFPEFFDYLAQLCPV